MKNADSAAGPWFVTAESVVGAANAGSGFLVEFCPVILFHIFFTYPHV